MERTSNGIKRMSAGRRTERNGWRGQAGFAGPKWEPSEAGPIWRGRATQYSGCPPGGGRSGMEFVRTMDLTSKQRAQLRGLANGIDTILIVGKEGIGDNLVKQANDALEARELIKGRVLENALMSAREAAEALAPLTRSEVVQVIGTKFVLYRQSHRKDKKDKIVLVEGKKR